MFGIGYSLALAPGQPLNIRVGHGWDLHRLAPISPGGPARPLILGGIPLGGPVGVIAHSDGDPLLHALTDAILGALALPDIGQLYPDTDPRWAGQDSATFLKDALSKATGWGWSVSNVDATVILQAPKLAPHKDAIRRNLSVLLGISMADVNVKAKTHEGVDAVGKGEAVEAHVVLLLRQP